jgi:hypothetical protein
MFHGWSRLNAALLRRAFKRTPEGWTFVSSYPSFFGRSSTYLLTDTQKATLTQHLRSMLLLLRLVALLLFAAPIVTVIWFPNLRDLLKAGSLATWLLLPVLALVVTSMVMPVVAIIRYRAVRPVLSGARRIGPARFRWSEFIELQAEATSSMTLIVRIAVAVLGITLGGLLFVASRAYAAEMLVVIVLLGLIAIWVAALLMVKFSARQSSL